MMKTTYSFTTTIDLAENPLEWQVKDLEALLLEKSRESLRKFFLELLETFEKTLLRSHPEWNRKERWKKQVSTLFGDLRLERYRVWDKDLKKSRWPLDEVLGIRKWGHETESFENRVMDQAVIRSYRQSCKEVERQTGSKMRRTRAWKLTQKRAQKQIRASVKPLPWKKLCLPNAPEPGEVDRCPAMGIDLDDTYCRSWKTKRWEKDIGVRVAVLYRHKEKIGNKKWLLKDKQVLASGPGEDLNTFLDRVTEKAITHYGLHQRTQVVVHGDGDPMIKNYALRYLPNALYRLDPWHVKKKIREATGIKQLPETWQTAIYGNPEQLIAAITALQIQIDTSDPSHSKIKDLIQYLKNNQEGLLPSNVSKEQKEKSPRLYRRGSGTIERNVDWTVNARFKQPRMSWSQKGLENLLHLRQNFLNQNMKPIYPNTPGLSLSILGLH